MKKMLMQKIVSQCDMQMFITVFESDNYYRMLKMWCLISKTCDAMKAL